MLFKKKKEINKYWPISEINRPKELKIHEEKGARLMQNILPLADHAYVKLSFYEPLVFLNYNPLSEKSFGENILRFTRNFKNSHA